MCTEGVDIIDAKPMVMIYASAPVPETLIDGIRWGLEEEGIPFEVQVVEAGPVETIAKRAADQSKLNVGIGICSRAQTAVLHHRDLPPKKSLFVLTAQNLNMSDLRRLGANAARLVKGNQLLFENECGEQQLNTTDTNDNRSLSDLTTRDELMTLIGRVIEEILKRSRGKS